MKIEKKVSILFLVAFLFSLLAGCGSPSTSLTEEDKDAVLAFSEGKTDNLLTGMNANDYAAFSRDFDQDMLDAMSQTQFDALKKDRDAKLGLYLSREVHSVTQTGEFYTLNYDAKFEKDDAVRQCQTSWANEVHNMSSIIWKALLMKLPTIESKNK